MDEANLMRRPEHGLEAVFAEYLLSAYQLVGFHILWGSHVFGRYEKLKPRCAAEAEVQQSAERLLQWAGGTAAGKRLGS